MKIQKLKSLRIVGLSLGILGAGTAPVWAQSAAAKTSMEAGTLLNVNGVAITEAAVARVLAELQAQGTSPTPQLREQIISEMVVRQVLVSEAVRRGLDKTPAYTQQLDELRRRLLVESLLNEQLRTNPITEQEERAEYARQKKLLGDGDTTPQYFLSQIVLKTEEQARDVIKQLKAGAAFEKLSVESIDESGKANNGKVGWVLPSDVLPAIGNVIVNLSKGSVAAAPIQSPAGWHVVKVDDVRPFKIPSFEESRPQVRQSLQVQHRQALVDGLLKSAEIQRP
jgi:peptidyl-prolyl cis-trans isomerase C